MQAIQYIRLIGKEFISLTDAELHLWVEMVRPIWSWMWRRLTEREPTWRRMPSMPSGTPSGRCRMTSTVWLEIAEWWMPSTPSMTFGGVLAP